MVKALLIVVVAVLFVFHCVGVHRVVQSEVILFLSENRAMPRTWEEESHNRKKRNKRAHETEEEGDARRGKRNKKGRDRRSDETEEDREARREERNKKDREKRADETREEKRCRLDNRSSQRRAKRQTKQERRSIDENWDITEEEFFQKRDMIEDETERKEFFNDIEVDPAKAVILFHLNSGYARFGGTRMFPDYPPGSDANIQNIIDEREIDRLVEEIMEEKLTKEEAIATVREFYMEHGYNGRIESCGSCGLRQHRHGKVKYQKATLNSIGDCWLVASLDGDERPVEMITIPVDKDWTTKVVNAWATKSLYYSRQDNKTYYLHPELVYGEENTNDDGTENCCEYTMLCHDCCRSVKLSDPPELSLARGVDFGDFERIGLEPLNMHEEVILGKMRLYSKFLKVRLNIGGRADYTQCKIQAHAVLFEDDSVFVAVDQLLDTERLKSSIRIHFVCPEGKNDWLMKQTRQATTLLARPFVVYQWAVVLQKVNKHYKELTIPSMEKLKESIEQSNDYILENAVYSNDEHDQRFEEDLGADIAAVRSRPAGEQEEPVMNDNRKDHISVQYAYVMNKGNTGRSSDIDYSESYLRAAAEIFDVRTKTETSSKETKYSYETLSSSTESSSSSSSDYTTDSSTGSSESSSESSSEHDPRSYRNKEPESEFDRDEYALCTAFPNVFLFGTGYEKAVANIGSKERHHLLHQFTCHPGRNRQLLGYLFDSKQRHEAIQGVSATVKGHRKSIEEFARLYERKEFADELKEACENPDGDKAKQILKTLMPILNFAGRKTEAGTLQLHDTPTRICESSKRYFSPETFVTISLDDISNPMSFRLSFRTLRDRNEFPSRELSDSELEAFINDETVVVGEGEIDCSYRARASRAMDNPVAYVTEYKACMLDIFRILFGIEPSTTKLWSDTNTVRKTRYFRDGKKGLLGYMLALNNVTEEHKKGTLHCHLVGWGGLSASLLQRAAGVDRLCEAIGEVLNSQFRAQLSSRSLTQLAVEKTLKELCVPIQKQEGRDPVLLKYVQELSRIEHPEAQEEVRRWKRSFDLCSDTEEQAKRQEHHDPHHPISCHEGFNGHTGCRFCKPSNFSEGTRPVELSAEDEIDPETGKKTIGEVKASTDIESTYFRNTKDRFDIRKKQDDRLIMWELNRPQLPEDTIQECDDSNVEEKANALREVVDRIDSPELLHAVTDILRQEDENLTDEIYARVKKRLLKYGNGNVVEHMPMLSRCTGSHNNAQVLGSTEQGKCAIFYTAGYMNKNKKKLQECLTILAKADRHIEQYPSTATDRTTSSIRKVQHLLTRTLNQLNLLQEVSDYQVALTLMEYPIEITTDSYAFLSPYAALSLRRTTQEGEDIEAANDKLFESMNDERDRQERQFRRDQGYESDDSIDNFVVHCEEEDENEYSIEHDEGYGVDGTRNSASTSNFPYYVTPEMYASLGPAPIYTIQDGNTRRRQPVPYPYHYDYRGKELRFLSRLEYAAFVGIRKKKTPKESSGRQCSADFNFGSGHVLAAYKVQYLLAKQKTVICCGQQPPYPGEEPTDRSTATYKKWKERADRFAEYVLIIFRPEIEAYEWGHKNNYEYRWEDLSAFIDELLNDTSFLSRLRLRAMEARVHGLRASYRAKVIMAKYRQKSRTVWSEEEKSWYERDRQYNEASRRHDGDVLDEHMFQQTHDSLSNHVMTDIHKQLAYCKHELESMDRTFSKFDAATTNRNEEEASDSMSVSSTGCKTETSGHTTTHSAPQDGNVSRPYLSCPSTTLHEKFETLEEMVELPDVMPSRDHNDEGNAISGERRIYGNQEQEHVRKLFEKYVFTDEDRHPFLYILTGPPGTGKSHTIEMVQSFASSESDAVGLVKTFAFFGIAAINVNGTTLSSVLHCSPPGNDHDVSSVPPLSFDMLQKFCNEISYRPGHPDCVSLIVIDEISTVSPVVLAVFNLRLQQATGKDEPFGGIPILLVGDFSQLPPVKSGGASLASGAVQIKEFDEKRSKDLSKLKKTVASTSSDDSSSNESNDDDDASEHTHFPKFPSKGKYSEFSLFRIGCKLLEECRWLQLTEQHRASNDPDHMDLILRMAEGEQVSVDDIRTRYSILSEDDYSTVDSKWLNATILVATNRERHFLTHSQCQRFARANKTHVIRWRVDSRKWEQAPSPNYVDDCERNDPCFWEYFVARAGGFFTDNLNKGIRIGNGTGFEYHSISPISDEQEQFLKSNMESLPYGEVITLDEPPLSVNVKLTDHEKMIMERNDLSRKEKQLLIDKYDSVSVVRNEIVVPIVTKRQKKNAYERTIVQGGRGYRPSRIELRNHFPIEPGFAATIHKAQGRTLDRVILALSHRELTVCNLSYEALYVALSRVRTRNDIRLLLLGDDPWTTLEYIPGLRPNPYVKAFFAGYVSDDRSDGAMVWNSDRAYEYLKSNSKGT